MRTIMIFLAAVLVLAGRAPAQAQPSSCVKCHAGAAGGGRAHGAADWKASPHASAGVDCSACHGGDPAASDTAGAHKGVKPSADATSAVYYTRVPETCGKCHAMELAAFKRSRHYGELARGARGPNCVTCHGSMANRLLPPREMEATCTLCHASPSKAYEAIQAISDSRSVLDRLDQELGRAKAAGRDLGAQRAELRRGQDLYREAVTHWHTFKPGQVLGPAREAARRGRKALAEVKIKESAR